MKKFLIIIAVLTVSIFGVPLAKAVGNSASGIITMVQAYATGSTTCTARMYRQDMPIPEQKYISVTDTFHQSDFLCALFRSGIGEQELRISSLDKTEESWNEKETRIDKNDYYVLVRKTRTDLDVDPVTPGTGPGDSILYDKKVIDTAAAESFFETEGKQRQRVMIVDLTAHLGTSMARGILRSLIKSPNPFDGPTVTFILMSDKYVFNAKLSLTDPKQANLARIMIDSMHLKEGLEVRLGKGIEESQGTVMFNINDVRVNAIR